MGRVVTINDNIKVLQKIKNITYENVEHSGHILALYWAWLSNTVPFCKNDAKIYFDAKQLEKGLNRGDFWPFLANIKCCTKFLENPLTITALKLSLVEPQTIFHSMNYICHWFLLFAFYFWGNYLLILNYFDQNHMHPVWQLKVHDASE